jgi:hypothetical protein
MASRSYDLATPTSRTRYCDQHRGRPGGSTVANPVGLWTIGSRRMQRHRSPGAPRVRFRRRFFDTVLPDHQPEKDCRWR